MKTRCLSDIRAAWSPSGARWGRKLSIFRSPIPMKNSLVRKAVDAVVDEINSPPVEPYAEINKTGSDGRFLYHEGSPGLETKESEVFAAVMAQLEKEKHTTITLKVELTEPKKTIEDIQKVTKYVSGFTTNVSGSQNRIDNVKKLAGIINATVVESGEEFSINALAGIRTEEAGWKLAPGIENGTYTDQPGGGVCQVSSTLYNGRSPGGLQSHGPYASFLAVLVR